MNSRCYRSYRAHRNFGWTASTSGAGRPPSGEGFDSEHPAAAETEYFCDTAATLRPERTLEREPNKAKRNLGKRGLVQRSISNVQLATLPCPSDAYPLSVRRREPKRCGNRLHQHSSSFVVQDFLADDSRKSRLENRREGQRISRLLISGATTVGKNGWVKTEPGLSKFPMRTKKPASDGETPKRVFRSIAVMKWP